MRAISDFSKLPPVERRAVLEGLAVTLADTAELAASEGEDALETVMRSVGLALREAADDLAASDIALAEDVAVRDEPHYDVPCPASSSASRADATLGSSLERRRRWWSIAFSMVQSDRDNFSSRHPSRRPLWTVGAPVKTSVTVQRPSASCFTS